MKNMYNYSEYLAEVHSLKVSQHQEYINCIAVIKKHVQYQISNQLSDVKLLQSRLIKLNTMMSIHEMMIRRMQAGKTSMDIVSLN
ncbi:MAG: hypothetical protein RJQ14_23580 [Marinoscillum sp.]